MNFLASTNPVLIDHYWTPLAENGEVQLLADFAELLWRSATAASGLVLVDTDVAGFPGMSGIAHLKRTNQSLKILLLTTTGLTAEEELAALAAGAAGSCGSGYTPEKIRQILSTVADGGVWISSAALPHLLERLKRWEVVNQPVRAEEEKKSDMTGLTPREREIVNLVAKGDSNKIIARELNITDRTVKAHLSMIFQKLKVSDRLQLALYARNTMQ